MIHAHHALPGSPRAGLGPHGGALPHVSASLPVPRLPEQSLKQQHGVELIEGPELASGCSVCWFTRIIPLTGI